MNINIFHRSRKEKEHLLLIIQKLNEMADNLTEFTEKLDRIDAATTNIAEDIRQLKEKITTGMSPADVQTVKDGLEARAVKLEGIAADTDDVVPEPPTG